MDALRLAAALPSTDLPRSVEAGSGASINLTPIPGYISPRLIASVSAAGAPAALIVAPAATGKTTSGVAIAARAGGVYLDLAGKRVGDGSFTGLLDEAFGEDDGLAFRKKLKSNQASVVVDALDEAQLASQEVSFTAFLRGMSRYLRTSKGHANVVLLTRRDTATYIIDAFQDENVPLNVYEIDYFNQAQSENFVASKLDQLFDLKKEARAHRVHVGQYQEARDSLFDRLALALGASSAADAWGSSDGRRLLGYSPVLEGLATYLCVQDYRIIDATSDLGPNMSEWALLTKLLEDLLEREQSKMLDSWPDDIQRAVFTDPSLVSTLYAPLEQCERLVARRWNMQLAIPVSEAVPLEIANEYSDAVKTQLLNHPFLSSSDRFVNSLIEDLATALVLQQTEDDSLRQGILQRLKSEEVLASPALGSFIIAMARGEAVPAHLLGIIMESFVSREDVELEYHFQVDGGDHPHLQITSDTHKGARANTTLRVALTDLGSGISLPPRVRNLTVAEVSDVIFPAAITRIGPNVRINAETVWFQGSELHIDASNLVEIEAVNLLAEWQQREFIHGSDLVVVGLEAEGWPLRRMTPPKASGDDDSERAYLESLRKVMRFFRRTQHLAAGELAARREETDSQLLKYDERAQRIVANIRARGWLREEGPDYVISPAFFSEIDSSITAIRAYQFSPSTRQFVRELAC